MTSEQPEPQSEPSLPTQEEPEDDEDDLKPTLTTPGGRFWDIPLEPQQQKALSATRFCWESRESTGARQNVRNVRAKSADRICDGSGSDLRRPDRAFRASDVPALP